MSGLAKHRSSKILRRYVESRIFGALTLPGILDFDVNFPGVFASAFLIDVPKFHGLTDQGSRSRMEPEHFSRRLVAESQLAGAAE